MDQFMDYPEEANEKFKTQHKRYLKAESRAINIFLKHPHWRIVLTKLSSLRKEGHDWHLGKSTDQSRGAHPTWQTPLYRNQEKKIADLYQSKE